MIDRPLDCVGTTGPVGKHDFRSHTESVRKVESKPVTPQVSLTAKQHLTIAQNLVGRALLKGTMSRQEALRAKECLEEVAKALV